MITESFVSALSRAPCSAADIIHPIARSPLARLRSRVAGNLASPTGTATPRSPLEGRAGRLRRDSVPSRPPRRFRARRGQGRRTSRYHRRRMPMGVGGASPEAAQSSASGGANHVQIPAHSRGIRLRRGTTIVARATANRGECLSIWSRPPAPPCSGSPPPPPPSCPASVGPPAAQTPRTPLRRSKRRRCRRRQGG